MKKVTFDSIDLMKTGFKLGGGVGAKTTPAKPSTPAKTTTSNKPTTSTSKSNLAEKTNEGVPPTTTSKITFKPTPKKIKIDREEKEFKVNSILEQIPEYTLDELRIFDKIDKKVINPPKFPLVKEVPKPVTETKDKGKIASVKAVVPAAEKAVEDKWDFKQIKMPDITSAQVLNAGEFFKSKQKQFKLIEETEEIHNKIRKHKNRENVAALFEKPFVQVEEKRTLIAPVKFTADMLRCAVPGPATDVFSTLGQKLNGIQTLPYLDAISNKESIKQLKIFIEGIASIDFTSDVDASNIDIENDVTISPGCVNIYKNKRTIPRQGSGLNCPAKITIEGAWPVDPQSGIRRKIYESDPDYEHKIHDFVDLLKENCAKQHTGFVSYDANRGVFTFITNDFVDGPFVLP